MAITSPSATRLLVLFVVFVVAQVVCRAADRKTPNDWLIIPGNRIGPITASTTHEDLIRIFGAANVVDTNVTVSDAGPMPGTVVFRDRPEDSLTILWPEGKPNGPIDSVVFCVPQFDTDTIQKTCHWHTQNNISFGTSLKQIEALNGGSFTLLGFGWDYQGGITSWKDGKLEHYLNHVCGGLSLRMLPQSEKPSPSEIDLEGQVSGDKEFSSSLKAMQELNPEVYWMIVSFDHCNK